MTSLPILPTMGVGSYAAPGWFIAARGPIAEGRFGAHDVEELFDDAVRITVADQIEAGIDILTDGELRRQRFVFEMYDRFEGLRRVPPRRKLGLRGYDTAPHFVVESLPTVPDGLGVVTDLRALKELVPDRPLKVALPGPLTFAGNIEAGDQSPDAVFDRLVELVRTELDALVAAGATYIQLDEPSLPHPAYGRSPTDGARIINKVLDGLEVRTAVHVCFGNNAGRPRSDRRFGRLMEAMNALACNQLVLEFANREMADIECLTPLSEKFDIAAGVVDVKNWRTETPDDVARRIRQCLEHMPAARLSVTADCGFSALPRYLARAKMEALVTGTKQVRATL